MYETILIESGSGIVKVNKTEYRLIPGTCKTIEPKELHDVINNGNKHPRFDGLKNFLSGVYLTYPEDVELILYKQRFRLYQHDECT